MAAMGGKLPLASIPPLGGHPDSTPRILGRNFLLLGGGKGHASFHCAASGSINTHCSDARANSCHVGRAHSAVSPSEGAGRL